MEMIQNEQNGALSDDDDDGERDEKVMRVDETLFPFCPLTRASSL